MAAVMRPPFRPVHVRCRPSVEFGWVLTAKCLLGRILLDQMNRNQEAFEATGCES